MTIYEQVTAGGRPFANSYVRKQSIGYEAVAANVLLTKTIGSVRQSTEEYPSPFSMIYALTLSALAMAARDAPPVSVLACTEAL